MTFTAINHCKNERFQVVWDLGRRCTYACTYCGPHHSNKTSPLVKFDDLKNTLDGVVEYANLLNKYRPIPKILDISYTGGEPTIHSDFWKFIEYQRTTYPFIKSNVTTNGCYTKNRCDKIIKNLNGATVSYHAEASPQEKELVLDNIQHMVDNNFNVGVNVMFHKDYFEECKKVVEFCKLLGIRYMVRPIGDSNDKQDVKDGYAHEYTIEQLRYFNKDWSNLPKSVMGMVSKTSIESIGRPCCNGKCLNIKVNNNWTQQRHVPTTNFFGWNCMVNWDFLFINSEFNEVYYHQTCKVNLKNEIGPIGTADNFTDIISSTQQLFETGSFPVIKCPKTHCGCGLCSPKALESKDAVDIFYEKTSNIKPVLVD